MFDVRHLCRVFFFHDGTGQLVADRESVRCELDRGLEQFRPGEPAIFFVRHFQHGYDAGYADGQSARDHLRFWTRLAVRPQEHVGRRGRRRGFAAVEGGDFFGLGVVQHEECAAAKTGGFGLDQREHHLCCDRRIDRRTALVQHFEPGLRGIGVRGRNHFVRCKHGVGLGGGYGGCREKCGGGQGSEVDHV
jgi:hypothetical protein